MFKDDGVWRCVLRQDGTQGEDRHVNKCTNLLRELRETDKQKRLLALREAGACRADHLKPVHTGFSGPEEGAERAFVLNSFHSSSQITATD